MSQAKAGLAAASARAEKASALLIALVTGATRIPLPRTFPLPVPTIFRLEFIASSDSIVVPRPLRFRPRGQAKKRGSNAPREHEPSHNKASCYRRFSPG